MNTIGHGFDTKLLYQRQQTDNQLIQSRPRGSASVNPASQSNSVFSSNAQVGTRIVYHSVSLQFSTTNQVNSLEQNIEQPEPSLFDFEAVAETVLGFISSGLSKAKENGATAGELNEMFEQARSGFNLGFDQALTELNELSLLDDSLAEGIEKSRSLITQGIDELHSAYFPIQNGSEAIEQASDNVQSVNSRLAQPDTVKYQSDIYAESSRHSDLAITTKDGDKVIISFSDIQQASQSERYSSTHGSDANYQYSASSSRETQFSFSVEGDLDEEELAAIEALISDVNTLQQDFFRGNIEKAYESALNLGFDNEQIATFSMDLQQSKATYASQTYQQIGSMNEGTDVRQNKELRPLFDFIERFELLKARADELLMKQDKQFEKLYTAVLKAEYGGDESKVAQFQKVIGEEDSSNSASSDPESKKPL